MRFTQEEFVKVKRILVIYEWAQRTLLTKLGIINEEFINFHESNPIGYITGRIKSPESIAQKLHNLNLNLTAENAIQHIRDIAGIRIICPFAKDIRHLTEILRSMQDINILEEKDYVLNPKPSGYRSYHVIAEIPVFYAGRIENIVVEIQIRTEAMNFWSTLEHNARYKYKDHVPQYLCDELVVCADKIAELDHRMFQIHEIILSMNRGDQT